MVAQTSDNTCVDRDMEFGGIWNTYVELSTTAFENGHYDVAETMLRAAYRQAPRDMDGGHTRMAIVLENLAEVFVKQKRYGKAERVYRRALGMNERARVRGARNAARICFKLAYLCLLSERLGMFDKWYQKSMEICKVATDIPLEEQATHMLKLVQYLHRQKNHELGWSIYKQVLAMRQDMQPPGAVEAIVNAAKMTVPSNVNL
ncbi:MAG: tetratricopeptide repeat protein [Candidatus Melainabacteria bacterium]|nr:MAG: tetratricopeptide repeat protein [Candidatus Melainabacteria bacterium]